MILAIHPMWLLVACGLLGVVSGVVLLVTGGSRARPMPPEPRTRWSEWARRGDFGGPRVPMSQEVVDEAWRRARESGNPVAHFDWGEDE